MNSHVVRELGVAYKANNQNNILSVIIFSVVFLGILTMTNSAPLNSAFPTLNEHSYDKNQNNSKDFFPIIGEQNKTEKYTFLTAGNMWLEILPDGTVKANNCPTKYGALMTGSHFSNTNKIASVYIKGVISNRYLCVTENGQIYASYSHHQKDCLFIQKPNISHEGTHVHYYKHLHHKNTYRTKKLRKKTVRFQLGFYSNGTVFVVQKHTQRKNKERISLIVSKRTMPNRTKCNIDTNIPKPKLRFKFCRKVWKNFFNASIKQLKRFRKYNCWDKIRQDRRINRKEIDDTG